MERKTVAIDLGHCETAAAIPHQIHTNDSQEAKYEVRRLVTQGKDQVIPTQILLTFDQMKELSEQKSPSYELLSKLGEIKIGNEAYAEKGEKFCYFKVPPKEFDDPYGTTPEAKEYGITHGILMACFAFALVNHILTSNTGDLGEEERGELALLVGCPTTEDWLSEDAQKDYASLIQKATGVHEVRIIPESRAAMFSSIENGKNKVSALNGAIVFDFGSSTADCTYMLLGRKRMEFSWTLGASEIEQQMMAAAYQDAVKSRGNFLVNRTSMVSVKDELRVAKESYYNGKFGSDGHPITCRFKDMENSAVDQKIEIDNAFMQRVTGEKNISVICDSTNMKSGTWQSLCKEFFEDAKDRISEKYPIETIVLTGGASRMDFVYELCQKVFPGIEVIREPNPSHTVSNGLGWVAITDANREECKIEAKKVIDGDDTCKIAVLRKALEDTIFEKISEISLECVQQWADAEGDNHSIGELVKLMTADLDSEENQKVIMDLCEEKINSWKMNVSAVMETAVNSQVKQLYSESVAKGLLIPKDIWATLQSGSIDFDQFKVFDSLAKIDFSSLGLRMTKEVIILAATIVGGGVGGTIGAVLGHMLGLLISDLISDNDLDKPRKQKLRKKIAKKMKKVVQRDTDDIMQPFRESFLEYENSYSGQLDGALTAAIEIVTLNRFEE